jgi:hypothetical protein
MADPAPPVPPELVGYAGPGTAPEFRDIFDPERLGRLAEPHRLRLGTKMHSRPASPLFNRASLPERVSTDHDARMIVPGAEFYAVTGHELGSFGLLQRGGRVLVSNEVQPHGFNGKIAPRTMPIHWARGLVRPDVEIIESDEPVGVVLNPHAVYGHFLLEMLARVHLLAELRALGRPMRVAVPTDAPAWMREFIGLYFAADQILPYDSQRQRVRAPCFVLPGMMMQHYLLHPGLNLVVRGLLDRFAGPAAAPPDGPRRLYLSRSRHHGWHALDNEAEVEAAMEDLGISVVHPQELPLPAQLALFARAECIVSPYSSAAHNALFAPFGTPVFCFGWMNRCQSGIAALRGQPIAYMAASDGAVIFPPGDRPPGVFRQQIDCRRLARELPAFLRFAEASRARAERRTVPAARPAPGSTLEAQADPGRIDAGTLTRTPWRYGHDGAAPAAKAMRFHPDGRIGGHSHPNEHRWELRDGVLSILDARGRTTVTFDRHEMMAGRIVLRGPFLLHAGTGLVLRLERAED